MSGIYIPGMEMPHGASELRLIIHPNGQVIVSEQTYWKEATAVPVPDHGRLVDADALYFRRGRLSWDDVNGIHHDREIVWLSDLLSATTIIPADKEDSA